MEFNRELTICEFTGKISYTEREAGQIVNDCARRRLGQSGRRIRRCPPKRKYFCKACGFWHLTHIKDGKIKGGLNARRKR